MTNPKGTWAETQVVNHLTDVHGLQAKREAKHGSKDEGDIHVTGGLLGPGPLVIEVKNRKSYQIGEWLWETEAERDNAGADTGLLVVKPRLVGATRVGDWWAIQRLDDWLGVWTR